MANDRWQTTGDDDSVCVPVLRLLSSVLRPLVTTASSDARPTARRRAASDSPAADWGGPRRASGLPALSPFPPNADRRRAASRDETRDSRGLRRRAARDTPLW